MNKIHLKYGLLLLCLFTLCVNSIVAQKPTLDSMIIISTGEYRPTVNDANKISSNPIINDSTQKLPIKAYGIFSKKVNTVYDAELITPAQMVGEPLTKLYNALVKLGMGTYTTPYGELWYNSLRSKDVNYGVHYKHLSSSSTLKNYGYSGFSDNEFNLYGKKFLKEHTLIGNFDYDRDVVHFYGYDTKLNSLNKDATVQRFNYFAANAELMSHYTKAERYNHDVKLSYYNFADLYNASENNIKASGFVRTTVNKELFKTNASVDFYNYKTEKDTTNNTIITLNPNFIASGEKYKASIGVTAAMDIFLKSKFYFYPNIDFSYNVFDDIIIPYIGASGGLQKNSFKTLANENPFVLSELKMVNSNHKYELFGGLKGTLSSNIAYNARVSYSGITNMVMYVNDTKELLQNRFNVIYDNAVVLNVRGEVTYQMREKLRINISGDYFNYKMKTELKAWYKPQLKLALSAHYNLKDKIVAKVDLFYIDNQYAKTVTPALYPSTSAKTVATQLKGVFDANVGVEYRYTKKLGFFLNFNNIANVRYYRYSNYPTQRFSLMGGLSYSF